MRQSLLLLPIALLSTLAAGATTIQREPLLFDESGLELPPDPPVGPVEYSHDALPPELRELAEALSDYLLGTPGGGAQPATTALVLLGPQSAPVVFEALRTADWGTRTAIHEGLMPFLVVGTEPSRASDLLTAPAAIPPDELKKLCISLVPVFSEAARSGSCVVRMVGIYHLGRLGLPLEEISGYLIDAMKDPVPAVRQAAASVIPNPPVTLANDLGVEIPTGLIDELTLLLGDADLGVRRAAVRSLMQCKLTDSGTIQALESLASDPDERVRANAQAAVDLARRDLPDYVSEQIEKAVFLEHDPRTIWGRLQSEHFEQLLRALGSQDSQAQLCAAQILGEHKAQLETYLPRLFALIPHCASEARNSLLWTLAEFPTAVRQHLPLLTDFYISESETQSDGWWRVFAVVGPDAGPIAGKLLSELEQADSSQGQEIRLFRFLRTWHSFYPTS